MFINKIIVYSFLLHENLVHVPLKTKVMNKTLVFEFKHPFLNLTAKMKVNLLHLMNYY